MTTLTAVVISLRDYHCLRANRERGCKQNPCGQLAPQEDVLCHWSLGARQCEGKSLLSPRVQDQGEQRGAGPLAVSRRQHPRHELAGRPHGQVAGLRPLADAETTRRNT